MPKWIARVALSTLLMTAAGCSDAATASQPKPAPRASDTDGDPSPDDPSSAGPLDESGSRGPLGVVAIDVQQVFFDTAARRNPTSNVAERVTGSARVFELAKAKHIPVFVTYELSKSSDHALPASVAAALPAHSREFIKTTFAATGQRNFLPAIKDSGVRRLLVTGAETDVCVLQTILGLRRAGYEVIAAVDALFTEEVNAAPALRRMRQAGVVQLRMREAEALVANGASSPRPPDAKPPVLVRPLEMGIVLHDLPGLAASDPSSSAKMVRLRELLLISEWFHLPLFAADPASALAALPTALRSIVTRPIAPLSQRPSQVTQMAVAGGRAGIGAAASDLARKGDVFLVEDALVGGTGADLEPLYEGGSVPTTYKTLYYELTQSVSDAEWPSRQWVVDGAHYFDLTKAPEDLPPLLAP